MKKLNFPRRSVLKLSLAASGLLIMRGIYKFLGYQEPTEYQTRITLATAQAYPVGSVTPIPQVRAYLLRDQAGLYALSGVCSHLGCVVSKNGSDFECPCHGSKFDLFGGVLSGPAIQPLRHINVSLDANNLVVVDTKTVVPANQRLVDKEA